MGKVLIAIAVEDGKLKLEHKNISANGLDIAVSISSLEMLKIRQIEKFSKLSENKI
ncbi:MAG: hypothetical protein AABY22_01515 [Nanoarchaeota archaeon]